MKMPASKYAAKPLPPVAFLRACLDYDRATGELIWKTRPREHFASTNRWASWNNKFPGTPAGSAKPNGYREVGLKGSLRKLHRVVWKVVTGREPPPFLDHIDGNRYNNRIENLRPATREQQRWNSCLHKNNLSGLRGVTKRGSGWIARIRVLGDMRYLGSFKTPEAASEAYITAAKQLHGKFYRNPTSL